MSAIFSKFGGNWWSFSFSIRMEKVCSVDRETKGVMLRRGEALLRRQEVTFIPSIFTAHAESGFPAVAVSRQLADLNHLSLAGKTSCSPQFCSISVAVVAPRRSSTIAPQLTKCHISRASKFGSFQEFCKIFESSDLPPAEMMEVQLEVEKPSDQTSNATPLSRDQTSNATHLPTDGLASIRDILQLLRILFAISRSSAQTFGQEGERNKTEEKF